MKNLNRMITLSLTAITLSISSLAISDSIDSAPNNINSSPVFTAEHLIYSNQEMLSFDVNSYLTENAPHLLPYAEVISHWSGYTSVSPKILIALMEQQTGVVTASSQDISAMEKPFGTLSTKNGFAEQVYDIADQLAEMIYSEKLSEKGSNEFGNKYAALPLQNLFAASSTNSNLDSSALEKDFNTTYERLFLKTRSAIAVPQQTSLFAPPSLELPYSGTWKFGGAHTNTGRGSYPMSSLDFYEQYSGGWGSNVSNYWVTASAGGSVKIHSSCFMEVIHSSGWSTTYYHLDNIQVRANQQVSNRQRIANYAGNRRQALCDGGSSTGPHLHFSVKNNGRHAHLNGVMLSGYKVKTGNTSYDSDCNNFWLEKNGRKVCAGPGLRN